MPWFLPYKDKADPALAARFHALTALPADTFGHAFAAFYAANKYAFPGEANGAEFRLRDSARLRLTCWLATIPRRAASSWSRPSRPRCTAGKRCPGHVLPVIFSWHLGIALNEVAGAAKGALDPQEFWHAWARGEQVKVDLFDPSWDFWAATREPMDAFRARIGLASVSECPDTMIRTMRARTLK